MLETTPLHMERLGQTLAGLTKVRPVPLSKQANFNLCLSWTQQLRPHLAPESPVKVSLDEQETRLEAWSLEGISVTLRLSQHLCPRLSLEFGQIQIDPEFPRQPHPKFSQNLGRFHQETKETSLEVWTLGVKTSLTPQDCNEFIQAAIPFLKLLTPISPPPSICRLCCTDVFLKSLKPPLPEPSGIRGSKSTFKINNRPQPLLLVASAGLFFFNFQFLSKSWYYISFILRYPKALEQMPLEVSVVFCIVVLGFFLQWKLFQKLRNSNISTQDLEVGPEALRALACSPEGSLYYLPNQIQPLTLAKCHPHQLAWLWQQIWSGRKRDSQSRASLSLPDQAGERRWLDLQELSPQKYQWLLLPEGPLMALAWDSRDQQIISENLKESNWILERISDYWLGARPDTACPECHREWRTQP